MVERPNGVELAVYVDRAVLDRVRAEFPAVRVERIEPGWEERWRQFHHGISVGPLWVGPPWEQPPEDGLPVVIDPGRAFGTGAHATTRLCLALLLELPPASLLDVGCGSGVLAIAAAKLGYRPVWGVDTDEAAVAATQANAHANAVDVAVRGADALADALPRTEVVVANVAYEPLEQLGRRLRSRYAITSGYLAGEHLRLRGYRRLEHYEADGWAAELFERR